MSFLVNCTFRGCPHVFSTDEPGGIHRGAWLRTRQNHSGLVKSPRSGVTLCFQSVSAASAAAKTFLSHIKTFWAKPLIFGTRNIWVWGNVLDDLSMTLTQGHGCGIHKQKFACLRDKVRNTHGITTQRSSFVALVMVITWLDFGKILLKTVILANFL